MCASLLGELSRGSAGLGFLRAYFVVLIGLDFRGCEASGYRMSSLLLVAPPLSPDRVYTRFLSNRSRFRWTDFSAYRVASGGGVGGSLLPPAQPEDSPARTGESEEKERRK